MCLNHRPELFLLLIWWQEYETMFLNCLISMASASYLWSHQKLIKLRPNTYSDYTRNLPLLYFQNLNTLLMPFLHQLVRWMSYPKQIFLQLIRNQKDLILKTTLAYRPTFRLNLYQYFPPSTDQLVISLKSQLWHWVHRLIMHQQIGFRSFWLIAFFCRWYINLYWEELWSSLGSNTCLLHSKKRCHNLKEKWLQQNLHRQARHLEMPWIYCIP